MFRISEYMHYLTQPVVAPQDMGPLRHPPGPVVIWNLTRRCNLLCKHCYTTSADREYPGELTTEQVLHTLGDLRAARVPALILSGGEPLLRPDIWQITARAKGLKFYTALSTNGTAIDPANLERVASAGYDYVGISLDGLKPTHDKFRGKAGAFDASLAAIRLCVAAGVKVGIRFTLTEHNGHDFENLLQLMRDEGVTKFYLSHLNYGGRGNVNRSADAYFQTTRRALDRLFEVAHADAVAGTEREYVTGNNDADGVYLWYWVRERFPEYADSIRARLERWGGNASGLWVANIDNVGDVHPDTYWWTHTLGNVKERAFGEIWSDLSDPLLAGLKQRPRGVHGRCGSCAHLAVCGGNTRVRALQVAGDPWAEDPGCYLTDAEIGIEAAERLQNRPFAPRQDAVDRAFVDHLGAAVRTAG